MHRQILDKIKAYSKIVIHRHVRPDPDAYGSSIGLYHLLQENYPEKEIWVTGKPDATLDYLATLKPVPDGAFQDALIIVTDTANTARIDDQRYTQGDYLIKIDHHPNEEPYGDLIHVDTNASSVSEMIYELFLVAKQEEGWQMNATAARLLYAGIVGDTGRFMFSSTSLATMTYAGELMSFDFDRTKLFNDMYEVSPNVLKLKGYVYENFKMKNGIGHVKMTRELLKEYGVNQSEASLLVSALADVKGMRAWVFFIEDEDSIRVRLRSKGPIINVIAKQFNGGGHPLASGATIYKWEEMQDVLEEMYKL
ncbi:bifunctional oligoribonuclease/PAP phosphatase NrnA [Chryseomicrobium palamuruense]|uniref:Bifunctional oligoribonuclease/PAP phosphatase NrnA n=1 Tax=Chryseomicrobium palamuruense TaxID=682973 RepID=A0ABV8UXH9_9BACL